MKLRLKELRKQAGLSQSELAELMGTTLRIYGSWEREDTALPFDKAIDAARILHCSLDELAGRKVVKDDDDTRVIYYDYVKLSDEGKQSVKDMISFTKYKESKDK